MRSIYIIKNRFLALMLAFALFFSALGIAFPAPASAASSSGVVRVKLTRLGTPSVIKFTTSCAYYANGSRDAVIPSGSTVTVSLENSAITMSFGGKSYSMGASFYISRASGGHVGAKFTSPSLSNVYCGDLKFTACETSITTLLAIYVEDYLYGVVGYEMSNSWPLEALKAQAIAARTYVLRKQAQRKNYSYDVTDSTTDQVFKGYNSSQTNVHTAVDSTRGVVAMYGTSLAQCYYTASNGGQIESTKNIWGGSLAYSVVKYDPYDFESSGTRRSAAIRKDASNLAAPLTEYLINGMADELRSYGLTFSLSDIRIDRILSVTAHTPLYQEPSVLFQYLTFEVEVTVGSMGGIVKVDVPTYGGIEDWYSLSINKQNNETVMVTESDSAFTVTFRRFGHGVGMSQCGAYVMAKNYSMSYTEILEFYYPGVKLTQLSLTDTTGGASGSGSLPESGEGEDDATDDNAPDLTGTKRAIVAMGSATDPTWIQSEKSGSSEKLATLMHGDEVYVYSISGNWAYCTDGEVMGYALLSRLLQTVDGEMYVRTTESAGMYQFVRAGKLIATLESGEYLSVYAYNGSTAYCMDEDGNKGFVATDYLKKTGKPESTLPPTATATPTPTPTATATPTPVPESDATQKPAATLPPPSQGEPMATLPPPSAGDPIAPDEWGEESPPTSEPTAEPTEKPSATLPSTSYTYAIVCLSSDSSKTYIYESNSSSSERIASLRHGDILRVYRYSGSWGYAANDEKVLGYVRLSDIMRKPDQDMYVQFLYDGKLFSHMDSSASRTASVTAGQYAKVIAYHGSAAYVETKSGERGFVQTKYLRKVSSADADW